MDIHGAINSHYGRLFLCRSKNKDDNEILRSYVREARKANWKSTLLLNSDPIIGAGHEIHYYDTPTEYPYKYQAFYPPQVTLGGYRN